MTNIAFKPSFFFALCLAAIFAGPVSAGVISEPTVTIDELFNPDTLEGQFDVQVGGGSPVLEGFAVGLTNVDSVSTPLTGWVSLLISQAAWDADMDLSPTIGFSVSTLEFGPSFFSLFGDADDAAFYSITDATEVNALSSGEMSDQFFYMGIEPSSPYIAFNYPPIGNPFVSSGDTTVTIVPVPPAVALLAVPLVGLGFLRRR